MRRVADLPMQAPSKYETLIDLNTGLTLPPGLLLAADQVIECDVVVASAHAADWPHITDL